MDFATLYESFLEIFKQEFRIIFNTIYDNSGYAYLGLCFIVTPILFFVLFYYLWSYPYGKFWHWLLWLVLCGVSTFGITWALSNELIFNSGNEQLIELLANPESGYEEYALTLPVKYASWNALFSVILGAISSLILKQFSKVQTHLPL